MITYAVAISGGVDSAVAAAKLLQSNNNVFGVTMILEDSNKEKLLKEAQLVASALGIPHYVLDLRSEFKKEVIDYFVSSYRRGLTPNPCAICNKKIKLHKLLAFAKSKGADFLATGHYAKIQNGQLYVSANLFKDQSYFLSLTSSDDLKYIHCPLQDITDKSITRELAKSYGLPNFAKTDSQDICFVPNNDYVSVIHQYSNQLDMPGDFIMNNNVIGRHKGIIYYTVGQRRGIGVSHSCPLYVTGINPYNNTVTLGKQQELQKTQFTVCDINILSDIPQNEHLFVKIRSGSKKFKAVVNLISNKEFIVTFLERNTIAVCPGQVCAIYDKSERVIAGGIISYDSN